MEASTTVNGLQLVTSQATVTWISSQPPEITISGTRQLQLPNSGSVTATVVDPVAPAGGAITVQWTQLSGPGTVTFDTPQQTATNAIFTAPGIYYLKLTAAPTRRQSARLRYNRP